MTYAKVKQHIKDHKEFYIGLGIGVGLAGITALIMRNNQCGRAYDQIGGADVHTTKPQVVSSSVSNSFNTITNNYNDRVKTLSYITRNVDTNDWWASQAEAAKDLNVSEPALSKLINHGEPIPGRPDLRIVREGVASAA